MFYAIEHTHGSHITLDGNHIGTVQAFKRYEEQKT